MLLSGEVVLIQVHIPVEVATQRKRVENRARSGFLKSCQADFLVLNEHVDKLTVQGLDLGGKGKNLLMNPLGLRFGNPNDADDSIEITTDVRVQPESKQVDNKIIFSNDEFVR